MVAFIQRGSCNFTKNKLSKLDSSMNRDFLFSGLNLNIIVQKKCARKMHNIWINALKICGIKYSNIETRSLFPLCQNFWPLAFASISTD